MLCKTVTLCKSVRKLILEAAPETKHTVCIPRHRIPALAAVIRFLRKAERKAGQPKFLAGSGRCHKFESFKLLLAAAPTRSKWIHLERSGASR
jgi:hypothetical protein